jgi:putative inorganic carbon (HCO3(-)) transporter
LRKVQVSPIKTLLLCLGIYVVSYALPFLTYIPYENRTEIWRAALYSGQTSPLLGHGFGNIETALHAASSKIDVPVQYYYVDSAHNIFLDFFAAGGIIGIISFSSLIIFTGFAFYRKQNEQYMVILLGLVTVLSFNPASIVSLLALWYILGQSIKQ